MKTLNTYMDHAWDDLAGDEDWWKATLVLGLMNCVPIIGQIFMFGYLYDWAKEAAWGMKAPLSRKLGDFGRCAKYGFLALWIILIWVVPVVVVGLILGIVPVAGPIIRFCVEVLAVVVAAIAAAAALRSIIYERVLPGLQVRRVWHMVRKDPGGLAQVFSIILLVVPLLVAALFIVLLPTIPFITTISSVAASTVLGTDLVPLVLLGMITVVVALVVWVAGALVSAFISALYIRALGYWMQQFEPDTWRSPTAPMAFEVAMAAAKEARREAKAAAKGKKRTGDGNVDAAVPEPPVDLDAEQAARDATDGEDVADASPDDQERA